MAFVRVEFSLLCCYGYHVMNGLQPDSLRCDPIYALRRVGAVCRTLLYFLNSDFVVLSVLTIASKTKEKADATDGQRRLFFFLTLHAFCSIYEVS